MAIRILLTLVSKGWGENGQCIIKMNCRMGKIAVVMANRNPGVDQAESGIEELVDRRLQEKGTKRVVPIVPRTVCTGVSLQKAPDRTYDRTATNVTYTLLATTITEQ